jgi:hypothetical protein
LRFLAPDVFVVRSAAERPELRAAEVVADELAFTHPRIARALLARAVPFNCAVAVIDVGEARALVEVGLEPRVLLRETPADTDRALDALGGGPLDVTIRLEGASLDVARYAWRHPGVSRAELGALLLAAVERAAEGRERAVLGASRGV